MITREFIIENKLSKDQVAAILADNPKYDAGWVDSAANLMTDNTNGAKFNEMMLCNLSAEKLSLIEQLFKTAKQNNYSENLIDNIDLFINPELNITQLQILITAFNNGVPIEWLKQLADPGIHYSKLNYIAQGMCDGFNMFDEIDPKEYDSDQVYEIFAGIKLNVDHRLYANINISAERMAMIRHALQLGFSVDIASNDASTITLMANDKK